MRVIAHAKARSRHRRPTTTTRRLTLVYAPTPVPSPAPPPSLEPCLPSGTEADINAKLVGPGATAVLCPGATFSLRHPVVFTAPNQRLYTRGRPVDATRAVLRVVDAGLTTAISAIGRSGVVVENVQVEGNRDELGYRTGEALILMGGTGGSDQIVRHIVARNTRSWSTIQVHEGGVTNSVPHCQGAQILDNVIGPAGTSDGMWADGISLACGSSVVRDNFIYDATDGGIVIFGAPGSLIERNMIVADKRQLLGGINMVDFAPVSGNYRGTRVTGNVIEARNSFIKVAVAMGPRVWSACWTTTNVGGSVTGNTLRGPHMGYGFAVSGVRDWTVTGNVDQSGHVGRVGSQCGNTPSPPGGFQFEAAQNSALQPEFTAANVTAVLGVAR